MTIKHSYTSTKYDPTDPTMVGTTKWNDEHVDSSSVVTYGAVGDGTADDTVAIQDAIDAVYAAGGGIVYFPLGTYKLTAALVLKAQVRLIGETQRGSILKQTGTGPVIEVWDAAPSAVWGCEIGFLSLQANLADAATGDGISAIDTAYGFSDCWMHDLFIQGAGRDGIHLEQTGVSTLNDWHQYLRIERVAMRDLNWDGHASGIGRYGLYAYGAFSTNTIRDCKFFYCARGGVHIEKNSNSACAISNLLETNVVQQTGGTDVVAHGVYVHGAHATTLINNYFEDISLEDTSGASAAICVDSTTTRAVNIIGNFSYGCHRHVSLLYGTGVTIDGSTFGWDGSIPAASTGIYIASTFKGTSLRLGQLIFGGSPSDTMTHIDNDSTGKPSGLLEWNASNSETTGEFFVKRLNLHEYATLDAYPTAPSAGTATWAVGDYFFNSAPSAGEPVGWVCTVAGDPGTWQPVHCIAKTAAPSGGPHSAGDVVFNAAPASGQPIGWICTAAGSPGTWAAMPNLA